MKAVVCEQPGRFSLAERPLPEVAAGEALVRIRRVGVCGTDLHAFRGRQPYFSYPRILGHELAGEVAATGAGVTGLNIGDLVTVIPYLECGDCPVCRCGRSNCCTGLQVLGVHRDGGMQEYICVPADHLLKAPGLSCDELSLVECMAIGAHAVRRAQVTGGETVLVIGAGPIGLGIMQFARIAGARVMALDLDAERLAFAASWAGVPDLIDGAGENPQAALADLTCGNGATVVFDATGSVDSMNRGFSYVGHGGRYLLVSIVDGTISFYDPDFHRREMTLLSSRNATRDDFLWVLDALARSSFDLTRLISHRCHYERLGEAFQGWTSPGSGLLKGIVEF